VNVAVKNEYWFRRLESGLTGLELAACEAFGDWLGHLTGEEVGVATATRDGLAEAEAEAEAGAETCPDAVAAAEAVGLAAEPAIADEAIELTPVTRTTTSARPMPGSNPGKMPALAVDGLFPRRIKEATVRRPWSARTSSASRSVNSRCSS
jgi:hypothetical protein